MKQVLDLDTLVTLSLYCWRTHWWFNQQLWHGHGCLSPQVYPSTYSTKLWENFLWLCISMGYHQNCQFFLRENGDKNHEFEGDPCEVMRSPWPKWLVLWTLALSAADESCEAVTQRSGGSLINNFGLNFCQVICFDQYLIYQLISSYDNFPEFYIFNLNIYIYYNFWEFLGSPWISGQMRSDSIEVVPLPTPLGAWEMRLAREHVLSQTKLKKF